MEIGDFLKVIRTPTARDKQRSIGASEYSSGCARCVTAAIRDERPAQGPYWLGAWIGTAVHSALENLAPDEWETETPLVIGELPGHGVIKSTNDLYIPSQGLVVDYKTTTRAKLKNIKHVLNNPPTDYDTDVTNETRFKVNGYIRQVMQYAWGLEKSNRNVTNIGLLFICRDGSVTNDIWYWQAPYRREVAEATWKWLAELDVTKDYEYTKWCYTCSQEQRR